jgi:transmembrane sensor
LALAASIAALLLPGPIVRWTADAATTTAEVRTIALPDGSTAMLGPESAIDIAFDDRHRLVRLLAGRAFFKVAHDTGRPFVVSTRQVETTVTGTEFDVRLAEAGVEVGVQQGEVRVEDSHALPPVQEHLAAGDWVQVGDNGAILRLQRPPAQIAAWQQGQLVAIDRPVGDVVEELRAYYRGRIVLLDSALTAKRVTGVYDLANPAAGLRALATAHGAHVTALSDWILVLSGG